jgi:phytoene dehydrogenase-like protein
MQKSIAIVGAGIAGLSAAVYARINGYSTTVFEMHDRPGGLCTGWQRQGYQIDACIHWLVGTKPGTGLRRVWEELGALQGKRIVDHEEFGRVESPDGKTVIFYTDVDRFEQHLLELSPADQQPIRELAQVIRKLGRVDMSTDKAPELRGIGGKLADLPALLRLLPVFFRYKKTTLTEFASRFEDPLLRDVLGSFFDLDNFPFLGFAFTLGWMNAKNAGYPVGGSLEFARSIERRYRELGGEIRYRAKVASILVEKGRAVGVQLEDGTEHRRDWVISAADGHATLFGMLGGQYVDPALRAQYERLKPFDPLVYVAFGVARDLSREPASVIRRLRRPVNVAGRRRSQVGFRHFSYDPTLAPSGKSVITSVLATDYDYWKTLADYPARYQAEKKAVADWLLGELEQRFPGIGSAVEMVDVATPLTFERYTGNWRGSFEGWQLTPENMTLRMKKTLPGLAGFFMVGQWVNPGGGLPPAGMDGKFVTQLICHADRRPFRTVPAPEKAPPA